MVKTKRVYERAASTDGARFLVDRVWPRGVRKTSLHIEEWLKDVAPSDALRHWFGHDPKKWDEFQRRYFPELEANPDAVKPLLDAMRQGAITLVYGAHDTEHNNAVALKSYLESPGKRVSRRRVA